MATTFYNEDGERAALRYWGGDVLGTRVDLLPGASTVLHGDDPLHGDDGSTETLRSLAASVGRNAISPAEREQRRREAFNAARQRDVERTWGAGR
jgi:hypothetical protein